MATWQFDLHLLPEAEVGDRSQLSAREFDSGGWWWRHQPPEDYAAQLDRVLPETRSWLDELRVWGSEDRDRIDVLLKGDRVIDVFVRIDARAQPSEYAAALANLAAAWSCVIRVAESGKVLPANAHAIQEALALSSAYRFVQDPEAFLRSLVQ